MARLARMGLAKLRINPETNSRLDRYVLDVLRANLWPANCQTCGAPLGAEGPALSVHQKDNKATATLHHLDCRRPLWSTEAPTATPHLTSRAALVMTPPAFV